MHWKTAGTVVFLTLCFGATGSWGQIGYLEEAERLNRQLLQLSEQGKYTEAARLGVRALAIREKVLGPNHPDTATSLNYLAGVYQSTGDYAQALSLYQRALTIFERVLGPEHPSTAISLNGLAVLYESMGNNAQALSLAQRASTIREKVLGPAQ